MTADVSKNLTLAETSTKTLVASSSKARVPPRRPGFGTTGKNCIVKANHFLVKVAENDLHHYDVTIRPEVTSKLKTRDVMSLLVEQYGASLLGGRKPAYDGRKSLYTAGPLPFESKEFIVNLLQKDGNAGSSKPTRKEQPFKVAIKFAAKVYVHHLHQFLRGRQLDVPQETIQVLDIVLRTPPSKAYIAVGRSFFSTSLGQTGELGDGLEYWRGYYQSLRPTQMGLSLNIDVSARAFYEPILVTDFIAKHFNFRETSRPLSDHDRAKVKKALKGIKVELTHRTRSFKITGLSVEPLSKLSFTLDDKRSQMSVVQYFLEKYNIRLKYTSLPAIQSGSESKPVFLPMEVCICIEQIYWLLLV
uniref:Uncharacterized protein MANES_04G011400 n=1 Tax=Rhizophora mucronata TaxID=61149 RepID=A0A2P2LIA9_RHIMU